MEKRIAELIRRLEEVEHELGQPDVFSDKKRYKELSQEHSYLTQVRDCAEKYTKLKQQLTDNRELLKSERDPDFVEVLSEDISSLEKQIKATDQELRNLLVPPDPNDSRPTILELRAGTGGDEAAIFVGDCVRMYSRYADAKGWRMEQLSATPSEAGGYKEVIMVLSGNNVHRLLQFEGGTHRVQRVPVTETQGRVHTSAVTVATMLEPGEEEKIVIDDRDLEIDTFRASGAGGQHVNVTDSAVRITHVPSGIVVSCQEERSQIKNRDKAMRLLKAKLGEAERQRRAKEMADQRAAQVGTGDRSEKIRTYNYPQNRVTDHRIGLTKYNLDQVMEGELDEIVLPVVAHFYQQRLTGSEE